MERGKKDRDCCYFNKNEATEGLAAAVSVAAVADGDDSTRSSNRSGCDEYSIPNPDMMTLISEMTNMSTRITSFSTMAAVWSGLRLMFKLPITTNSMPTSICRNTER